jgi:hypothetical protein
VNLTSSVEPSKIDLANVAFKPAMSTNEMRKVEKISQSFGVQRRIALALATKSRSEMTLALNNLRSSSDDDVFTLLDCVSDYLDHLKATTQIVEMVQARVIVTVHDVFGIPFDDTESDNREM